MPACSEKEQAEQDEEARETTREGRGRTRSCEREGGLQIQKEREAQIKAETMERKPRGHEGARPDLRRSFAAPQPAGRA